jgi:sugar lactone lactonase YvrE
MNLSKAARAFFLLFFAAGMAATLASAEGTRTWEQSKFDDLSKGSAKGVAIRSTGGLELAPALKPLFATPSTYIWALASDASGVIYAATGAPARIYRVTPDGTASIIFEAKELQVQSIIADKSGTLYAATNPDGKIFKLERKPGAAKTAESKGENKAENKAKTDAALPTDPNWTATVFFDPATRYLWDLALDGSGNLFVATGDGGQILKVTPGGEHSVFFKSDENHIRKLAFDRKGNLIAGSDGSGLIYRITPSGEAFVLYSAAKREITALAVDDQGNIYAAGVGEKRGVTPQFGGFGNPSPVTTPTFGISAGGQGTVTMGGPASPMSSGPFPFPALGATGGSEIYRISPDGAPLKIWSARDDIVYALAFDPQGRLLAGTGNRGHVFAVNPGTGGTYSDLLKTAATQVTAFAPAPNGSLYAATSNLGKLFSLGTSAASDGEYESDVFDAHIFSHWGRAEVRSSGNVELWVRAGNVDNPDRNWSAWKKLGPNHAIDAPAARFLQWKAVLRPGTPAPALDNVLVNYLPNNVAPEVDDVAVQIGVHYQAIPKLPNTDIPSINSNGPPQPHFEQPVPAVRDLDSIGVKWTAHDDNDDQLTYALYYRGDGESRWLLLKDNLTDKFYSFEASLLPDDGYTFKVVASDAPSHSPGDALTDEREGSRVEIDTTPPRIEGLTASAESNGELHVTFRAVDSFSPIKRAEYSLDAGEWQFVEPAGKLSDAKTEDYDFRMAVMAGEHSSVGGTNKNAAKNEGPVEHVVVVRVYDRYDNLGTAKFVVRGR